MTDAHASSVASGGGPPPPPPPPEPGLPPLGSGSPKLPSKGLQLLVIGAGFGGGLEGAKYKYLAEAGHDIDFFDLPEPTAYDNDAWA